MNLERLVRKLLAPLLLFFINRFILPAGINKDYEHFAGSMTFTGGRRTLPVEVTIINDDTVEQLTEETFNVTVSRFPGEYGAIKILNESSITVVIRDDDSMQPIFYTMRL